MVVGYVFNTKGGGGHGYIMVVTLVRNRVCVGAVVLGRYGVFKM